MPRTKRKESKTGIYHVMLRGINRQQIFEDSEDCEKFLQIVEDCKEICQFTCYAYCLMGNHVHLLIKTGQEPLSLIFRRFGVRYVSWYNRKYSRSGPLFQDRYKSELVEDDTYLLSVVRYIHQNPVKAGLTKPVPCYQWSSAGAYLGKSKNSFVDTAPVLQLFSEKQEKQIKLYQEYMHKDDTLQHLENKNIRLNDKEAREIMIQICGVDTAPGFQEIPLELRNDAISKIHQCGVSIRQLARLTGLPVGVIRKFM